MWETLEAFAKTAPAFLVPLTAIGTMITAGGVLVSLHIGLSTLREIRLGRAMSVRPSCLFETGGQSIEIEFEDSGYLPGIDPRVALSHTAGRPTGKNRASAKSRWGRLKNYGLGPAIGTRITFLAYRIFMGDSGHDDDLRNVFVIDEAKRAVFPYLESFNSIPATPSHLPVGSEASFGRLPTPIVVDYQRRIRRMDCVIKLEYKDVFGNKFEKFQGVRVFADYLADEKPKLILTFIEEIDPRSADFSIFGPPVTAPVSIETSS